MPDSPDSVPEEKFEFELGKEPNNNVYWVLRGGRAAMKCLEGPGEGKYRVPHFGIVDGGFMTYVSTEMPVPLEKESVNKPTDYDAVKMNLERCRDVAMALLSKKELWGIHIHDILDFYQTVRGQSDTILIRTQEHHPEFEKYKLPDIKNEDETAMQEVARRALENALKELHA